MIKQFVVLTFSILLISFLGCTANLAKDVVMTAGDTVVVIGVNNISHVEMGKGTKANQEFKPTRGTLVPLLANPENGYIIKKLTAISDESRYGISEVNVFVPNHYYGICNWKQTLAFEGPSGKVIYIGDLNAVVDEGVLSFKITNNIEKARAFINSNYPYLNGRLEYKAPELLGNCSS